MKKLKYILILLAGIAAPLWIALTEFKPKADSKTTFALDTTTIKYLSNTNLISSPKTTSNPTQININGNHLDSLFMFLSKSVIQKNSNIEQEDEKLRSSIQQLINVSTANSQIIQGLLTRERSIRISLDTITINQNRGRITPDTTHVITPSSVTRSLTENQLAKDTAFVNDLEKRKVLTKGQARRFRNIILKRPVIIFLPRN